MIKYPTPYEIAILAAHISPQDCRDGGNTIRVLDDAISLFKAAIARISWLEDVESEREETSKIESVFLESYGVRTIRRSVRSTDFQTGIYAITGVTGARLRRAETKFKEILKKASDMHPPDLEKLDPSSLESMYKAEGFSINDLIYWRAKSEQYGFCRKKLLTEKSSISTPRSAADNGVFESAKKVPAKPKEKPARKRKASAKRR